MKVHCKRVLLRGAADCKTGGWAELVGALVDGVPIECSKCLALFSSRPSFSIPVLERSLQEFRDSCAAASMTSTTADAGDEAPSQAHRNAQQADQVMQNAPAADSAGLGPQNGEDAGDVQIADADDAGENATEEDGRSEVRDILAANPCLHVLEEGTLNKRIPVRSDFCIRRSTGQKAVFEPGLHLFLYV